MLAIQHVLHDIPTCPQRIPPKVIEGMFATVIVNALSAEVLPCFFLKPSFWTTPTC